MGIPASTVMPVPVAPVNKNGYFLLGKDNIRLAWKRLIIDTIPVSHRKEAAAYHHLNAGIFALNVGHDFTSPVRRNRISHYTDKSRGRSEISFNLLPSTRVFSISFISSWS